VQFKLDNVNLGAELTAPPYTMTWSTAGATNGAHALTAVARDTANLTTPSAPVPVTVSNGGGGTAAIEYVQGAYAVPQSPQTTVAVAYPAAQTGGNLNVVLIGWNDGTARVTSVTDSRGNVYAPAGATTVLPGQASHAIWYARNIAAGSSVVTVRFDVPATFADVRILEYRGLDATSPLLGAVGGAGSGALSTSGALTTTVGNVLLVAGNVVQTTTPAAGTAFTSRMITNPNGDIAEDRVVATAGTFTASAPVNGGYWVMQMAAFAAGAGGAPPDTTPPSVAVTAPAAGASVAGSVTLAASAADNVAVAGVQFRVNGVNVGAEVTAPPYYAAWNTTTVADGTHVVTAVARDAFSNTTASSPVSVTVSNATATAPSRVGSWSATSSWPLVAVHATLLSNGDVLVWDAAAQSGRAYVWTPTTNTFTLAPALDNVFCAGFAPLPDGRTFLAGGHVQNYIGIRDANIFDPSTRVWTSAPPMQVGRWYPTVTTLPDGRMLVVSGAIDCEQCIAQVPEIYNPVTNTWTTLPNAALELPIYPHMFVLPDGRVLATSAFEGPSATVVLDVAAGTWSVIDPNAVDGHSSAMYRLGKVMKSGTSANSDAPFTSSQATTFLIDMTQPSPAWRATPPMAFARAYHNLTILPDGNVLATGGSRNTDAFDESQAVLAAELWSPATETWTTVASMSVPRLYHSIALLLPDGRVLAAGGGRFGNPTGDFHDKLNAQIYSPPYLFKGARPSVTAVANVLSYGAGFTVSTPDAARIASVVLIAPGAVTHGFDQGQRFVPLSFTVTGGTLNVQAPANAAQAPPGHYMLFIVDGNGVPSVAPIVKLQ
jgi:hypothetical protein